MASKAKKDKDDKEIPVVAELKVTWNGGSAVVRSFDTAWHLGKDKASDGFMPVTMSFLGFVRKD